MSFHLEIDPKRNAGNRLIFRIIREIQRAYAEEKTDRKLTQQEVAERLGVNRSVVNRWLQGKENLTVRSLGELMWAMDREWVFSSKKVGDAATGNAWPQMNAHRIVTSGPPPWNQDNVRAVTPPVSSTQFIRRDHGHASVPTPEIVSA